jgi:hypothetical protein
MKCAVEMGSGAVIYILDIRKTGSAIQKFMGWDTQTHRQHAELMSILSFFK